MHAIRCNGEIIVWPGIWPRIDIAELTCHPIFVATCPIAALGGLYEASRDSLPFVFFLFTSLGMDVAVVNRFVYLSTGQLLFEGLRIIGMFLEKKV